MARMIKTIEEFPPRQEAADFSIGKMMAKLKTGIPSS